MHAAISTVWRPGYLPVDISALTVDVVYEDAGDGCVCRYAPDLREAHTQGEDSTELVLKERRSRG